MLLFHKAIPPGADHREDIEEYQQGGYHPVHMGDLLDRRYKVLHKLGWSGHSTTG
jgi:serine/threonine-protein kinase SRPK3